MPELPQKKVGIISCSGEEMAEGTVSRLAALQVLEKLRPGDTVTICLPLFLAGGEGDRAFAKFYPTIAVDGCEKRCAFRGTEQYSNRPAVGIVVSELVAEHGLEPVKGSRTLNAAGMQAVGLTANQIAGKVDELLGKSWNRHAGDFSEKPAQEEKGATCSCGSGIPVQSVFVNEQEIILTALPLIFESFFQMKKSPVVEVMPELMAMVRIYNPVNPTHEKELEAAVLEAYAAFYNQRESKA